MRKVSMLAALAVALLLPSVLLGQTSPGAWSVNSTPAVNVQATASRAAGTGSLTHVATHCSGSITTIAAQTAITLSLRNGATGAGTVLWSLTTSCAIGTPCTLSSGVINIVGSGATAMTCEWSGAPVTNNFAVATLTGFDVGSP